MSGLIHFNGLGVLQINGQEALQINFHLVSGLKFITKQYSLHISNKIIPNDATWTVALATY